MTRGTFAFFDLDPENTSVLNLYTSIEFNGDMGPDMECGKRYLPEFAKVDTLEEFESFLHEVVDDYGYDLGEDELSYKKYSFEFKHEPFWFFISTNAEDTKKDPWATYFHYSDYGYVKCSKNITEKTHINLLAKQKKYALLESAKQIFIYHYGNYLFCKWRNEESENEVKMGLKRISTLTTKASIFEIPDANFVARGAQSSLKEKLVAVLPKMRLASIRKKLCDAMQDGWQYDCCELITAEELEDYEDKTGGNDLGYDLTRYLTMFGYRVHTKRDANRDLRIDISWKHHLHLDNV